MIFGLLIKAPKRSLVLFLVIILSILYGVLHSQRYWMRLILCHLGHGRKKSS